MTSPEPQNDVEKALVAAAGDNAAYADFLRALAGSEILIPQPQLKDVAPERRTIEEGDELTLPLVEHEGKTYVPVFTSIEQFRLGVSDEGMAFIRLPASGLLGEWPEEHGMAVNPGGDVGIALDPATVRNLDNPSPADSPARRPLTAGSKVVLGHPSQEPRPLLDAIAGECRSHGGVRAAYRAMMAAEGEEETPQIVIGIELDEDQDPEQFFADVGPRVASAAAGTFSFIVVDEANLSSVARFMLLDTDHFFVRAP